jgi:nucleotide-binding universal stress UspA family protein
MFHRILCPIDFSETCVRAMTHAEPLAEKFGAELILLHAFDTPETYDRTGQTHPADRELEPRLREIQSSRVKVRHALHAGPPGDVICWFAEANHCDLIVMGTHGRTGLKHFFLGSVAEHVVRHARCPVLVLRGGKPSTERLEEPLVLPPPPPPLM